MIGSRREREEPLRGVTTYTVVDLPGASEASGAYESVRGGPNQNGMSSSSGPEGE